MGYPIDENFWEVHSVPSTEVQRRITMREYVLSAFKMLQQEAHQNAVEKGFWDEDRGDIYAIALMHSELSEALEGMRHGNPPSDHIPEYSAVEEEFADVLIRILDTCEKRGYRLAEAILAKMKYNRGREYKHGGKKF